MGSYVRRGCFDTFFVFDGDELPEVLTLVDLSPFVFCSQVLLFHECPSLMNSPNPPKRRRGFFASLILFVKFDNLQPSNLSLQFFS